MGGGTCPPLEGKLSLFPTNLTLPTLFFIPVNLSLPSLKRISFESNTTYNSAKGTSELNLTLLAANFSY